MRNLIDHPLFLLILVLLVVLLFGAKRLPDAARSIGRSMRIFKSEVKEMKTDDERRGTSASGSSAESDGGPSRPLEGRVVDDAQQRREQTSYDQQRHSA